jgi:hypothetical protein
MHNGKSVIITSLKSKVNVVEPHRRSLLKIAQLFMSSIEHIFAVDKSWSASGSAPWFSVVGPRAGFICPKEN